MGGLRGARAPSQTFSASPLVYAWMIQIINILMFRVRPRACYMKGTMKRQKSIYHKFTCPAEWNRVQLTQIALEPISEDLKSKKFSGGGHIPPPTLLTPHSYLTLPTLAPHPPQ